MISLTLRQLAEQALARAHEVSDDVPATYALMYRRAAVRQRDMAALAAQVNADYWGGCAYANVSADGAVDLLDIDRLDRPGGPLPSPETINRVLVDDPGTSAYQAGDEVSIVQLSDIAAALPPRMMLRNKVLRPIGGDMNGVASVMVFYSQLSPMYAATDHDTQVDIPSPHDEILVCDLARWLLAKLPATPRITATLAALAAEEAERVAQFVAHVEKWGPHQTRFARVPEGTTNTQ